jgi:hypothetical protein
MQKEHFEEVLAWDAPEYYHWERSADWYWSFGIIVASVAILSVLFENILFAIFVVIVGILAGYYASLEPRMIHYELQPRGLLAGDKFHEYADIKSFWVDVNHPHTKIIFTSKKMFAAHIVIPSDDSVSPEAINHYLAHHLPQVKAEETPLHKILEQAGL